ncbi:MAG: hypothetical protein AB1411_01030 [Nitrospirota bacterium]
MVHSACRAIGVAGLPATLLLFGLAAWPPAGPAEGRAENPGTLSAEDRRQVGMGWGITGWGLVEVGDYRRAAEAFAAASLLLPDEAGALVGLGLSRLRLFQDEPAREALERALRVDPQVGRAHALLGAVYERRGEARTALRHYEVAFDQDPNDVAVQERLPAVRRAARYDARLDRLFSAHFVIKYPGPRYRAVASAVGDRLEDVYRSVGRTLSYYPAERVTVILYSKREFRSVTASPGWAGALFDGVLHLSTDEAGRASSLGRAALRHEYAHAAVHRLSRGRAPAWLSEGLALHCEGGEASRGMRRPSGEGAKEPLRLLHGNFLERAPDAARVAYAESYGATAELIRRYGMGRVKDLLAALAGEPDFSRAFEMTFGERYSDFDRRWLSSHGTDGQSGERGG